MAQHYIVEDPTGARATVGFDSLHDHELRGFAVVGPAIAPGDPRTPAEAAQEAAAADAAVEALRAKLDIPAKKPAPKKEN